jgi:ubiquinol-cytochrome c reductase cytochrome b subunit
MIKFSPSPSNINYIWNFGSLLIFILIVQIVSGIFISFHYNSYIEISFFSVVHINREVNFGWIIRIIHINGASIYFVLIFRHTIKNIINSSWKFIYVWFSGIIILFLSIIVAFIGYVLPWGQISFWAAIVITNLLSAIPYLGVDLVEFIWGGFSVSYPTLIRFFSFHFFFPFIILIIVFIHIIFLHNKGSSNTIRSPLNLDKIRFDPYFSIKDIIGLVVFFFFFIILLLLMPYYSVDSENFVEANPIITPIHIKPEWYFLFAYAILRSIPNKIGGVLALLISIIILFLKPLQKKIKIKFNFIKKIYIFFYFHIFLILTFLGRKRVDYPFEFLSIFYTISYFILVLII